MLTFRFRKIPRLKNLRQGQIWKPDAYFKTWCKPKGRKKVFPRCRHLGPFPQGRVGAGLPWTTMEIMPHESQRKVIFCPFICKFLSSVLIHFLTYHPERKTKMSFVSLQIYPINQISSSIYRDKVLLGEISTSSIIFLNIISDFPPPDAQLRNVFGTRVIQHPCYNLPRGQVAPSDPPWRRIRNGF